jgi:two-component system, NarL family, nitrate/nitrite response regulator NarL
MTESIDSIRLVIADERATFRETLRTLLEPETDLMIVGEASDAAGVRVLAKQLEADVIVIDAPLFYRLNTGTRTQLPYKTMVTVSTLQRADIIKAFLQGARAVVPKLLPRQTWSQGIRTVGAGQYWLRDESVALLLEVIRERLQQGTGTEDRNDYRLTPREVEIVGKVVQGHSNREVGEAFSICEKTVKHHLTNIFTKVGVSSRLELAVFALNHRLPEHPSSREAAMEEGIIPITVRRGRTKSQGY